MHHNDVRFTNQQILQFVQITCVLLFLCVLTPLEVKAESLEAYITNIDSESGILGINGNDSRHPSVFDFDWGDCRPNTSLFPACHTYEYLLNYDVRVIANYDDGDWDEVWLVAKFLPEASSPDLTVTVPSSGTTYDPTACEDVADASPISDGDLVNVGLSRAALEATLSSAAEILYDMIGNDLFLPAGDFRQVVLEKNDTDSPFEAIWYTAPPAIAGPINGETFPWVPFFHELAHNFVLNSPARFRFGKKVDGNASTILIETTAYILERAVSIEMLAEQEEFAIPAEIIKQIQQDAENKLEDVRQGWRKYTECCNNFSSWNFPITMVDETEPTFKTLAYEFIVRADARLADEPDYYRSSAKRMIELLHTFDREILKNYSPLEGDHVAGAFRATFMVAALSHGLESDLRNRFYDLGFPIDNSVYNDLFERLGKTP